MDSEEKIIIELKLKRHCVIIYILYALSALLQFSATTLMLGIITLSIAYILNGNKKKKALAENTIFASHLRWARRTFWIGTGVYFPIATIIATILVFKLTDITSSGNNADIMALMLGIQHYMETNITKVTLLTMIPILPVILWWFWRLWVGYKLLNNKEPIKNVTSWI